MKNNRSLKIALIGTRGIPANYGGFETCVEEVGKRLAKKGHHVTVYCRKSYSTLKKRTYKGINRVCLPNLQYKSLDTISHTIHSVLHSIINEHYDVYMVFNSANSILLLPLRILGKKIAINPDGLEWKRSKWGKWAKLFYKCSEVAACLVANRLISDSKGIKDYYWENYKTDSTNIAYGAYIQNSSNNKKLKELNIEPNSYFLQITRFEPENHPLLTIKAFKKLKTDKKLVIIGSTPYPNTYTREIESEMTSQILLPGFIYEKEILKELWCNCIAYIHGNSVGGTNPALLQAMASGCYVISGNVSFNQEVLGDCGTYFDFNECSLAERMNWVLENESHCKSLGAEAQQRVKDLYSWDKIAMEYERLFIELFKGKYPWRANNLLGVI